MSAADWILLLTGLVCAAVVWAAVHVGRNPLPRAMVFCAWCFDSGVCGCQECRRVVIRDGVRESSTVGSCQHCGRKPS